MPIQGEIDMTLQNIVDYTDRNSSPDAVRGLFQQIIANSTDRAKLRESLSAGIKQWLYMESLSAGKPELPEYDLPHNTRGVDFLEEVGLNINNMPNVRIAITEKYLGGSELGTVLEVLTGNSLIPDVDWDVTPMFDMQVPNSDLKLSIMAGAPDLNGDIKYYAEVNLGGQTLLNAASIA